jgi:hypothetical protein
MQKTVKMRSRRMKAAVRGCDPAIVDDVRMYAAMAVAESVCTAVTDKRLPFTWQSAQLMHLKAPLRLCNNDLQHLCWSSSPVSAHPIDNHTDSLQWETSILLSTHLPMSPPSLIKHLRRMQYRNARIRPLPTLLQTRAIQSSRPNPTTLDHNVQD